MKGRFRIFKGREGQKAVFFPFDKTFVETDEAGIETLRAWSEGRLAIGDSPFLENLEKRGLIGDAPSSAQPADRPYLPTAVTLLSTQDCNLRCRYCYSSGGERKTRMPLEIGKTAVNLIAANAVATEASTMRVTFHGGGEPSTHWDFLTAITEYSHSIANGLGLECSVHIGSNAVLSDAQIDWMMAHLDSATISIDGPADIHDAQRPTEDGRGSHASAMHTLARFEVAGFPYQIRTTVTRALLPHLESFIDEMATLAPSTRIHQLEPMFPSGRGTGLDDMAPAPLAFRDAYRALTTRDTQHHYPITLSSCDVGAPREHYCGAYGDNFVVTPEGKITTCYEVGVPSDGLWDLFHIGEYADGKFRIFGDKLAQLRARGGADLDDCGGCFARYTCGGDCPVKRIRLEGQPSGRERCHVIKTLTLEGVRDKLDATALTVA